MLTDYSKPAADIADESAEQIARDGETLERQRRLSEVLQKGYARRECVLCRESLAGAPCFDHRGVPYLRCPSCDHVQSGIAPPAAYPNHADGGLSFAQIYPRLGADEYRSRRDRIYAPKLDWALDHLAQAGVPRAQALAMPWRDLGAGAGYFIDALRMAGAKDIAGVEADAALVARAGDALGPGVVAAHGGALEDAIERQRATVHVALFVLEHVEDAHAFWQALGDTPPGSALLFAVPCFGFSTMLEGAFGDYAARNLDSVVHTQLYTDRSIARAVAIAGYEPVAEWIFGQDAVDLHRLMSRRLRAAYPDKLFAAIEAELSAVIDPLQAAIDKAHLADARHVLAIKR